MRKIKTGTNGIALAVTALLMFQSLFALSQSNINLDLYKPGTEIAFLQIDSLYVEEPATVTIKDASGVVLYKDQLGSAAYSKLIDFSQIEKGRYFVDIALPSKVVRKVITKEDKGLSFIKDSFYLYNSVKRLNDDDKKMLVKIDNKLNEVVTIRITDDEGHVLLEKIVLKSGDYTALLNLSKLTAGVYNMSLSSGTYSESKSLIIE